MTISRKTIDTYKEVSGKTWKQVAQDLGVGERYLRKIRSGERAGKPTVRASDRLLNQERTRIINESVNRLVDLYGTKKRVAEEIAVNDRTLRKILSGESRMAPTADRIMKKALLEGVGSGIKGLIPFTRSYNVDRLGSEIAKQFQGFRGQRKSDIDKIIRKFMLDEGLEDEGDREDVWNDAREKYEIAKG